MQSHIEGGWLSSRRNVEGRFAIIQQTVETGWLLAAHVVDGQVARDGEEPGAEAVLVVELVAAFEHANPGFLEKVFGQFAASCQVHEIAEQAMLVLFDQTVEQVGIATKLGLETLGPLWVRSFGIKDLAAFYCQVFEK